jgi:hypothetical protein
VANLDPYDRLIALPAWLAYSASPEPSTLGLLLKAVGDAELRGSLPRALTTLFTSSANWRVAQHLANELMDEHRDTTLAEYYAAKAIELSAGDLVARLSLARCFWLQRFPEAVLSELNAIERLLLSYEPVARRAVFQHEIADLYVNTYSYANRLDLARPWIEQLLTSGRLIRGETLVQAFTAAFHHDERGLALRLARLLAPGISNLSGWDQKRVTVVIQTGFLQTIRSRP